MELTPRDIFIEYFIDDPQDLKSYMLDAMDLIHGEAQRKKHEFDGYFQSKWEDAANTISQFNECYFDDIDRKWLYVYLSSMIDDEIFGYLTDAYEVIELVPLNRDQIKVEIKKLIDKGTKF